MAETKTDDEHRTRKDLSGFISWRPILAICLMLAGPYYVMPALFMSLQNKMVALGVIILFVPLLRVTTDYLLGAEYSPQSVPTLFRV